jgi:phosphatidate phosphatase APP1
VAHKFPILLSFYGLSNGSKTLLFGQLTYTPIRDLTFQDYSRRKTFRTLFRLYHTKPYSNQELILVFDTGEVKCSTNSYGAFYEKRDLHIPGAVLKKVLLPGGEEVKVVDGLYPQDVHHITSETIVVSDIDDTLLHSFIYRKLRKLRTMMFTTMENRKAVENMQALIRSFTEAGASPVYLSNSEQNLYPMIYRFLSHNKFPKGPLFLKQLRSLWDVIWNIKFPLKNIHKTNTLEDLINLFPDRKFVLMGDNTQHDLQIYLSLAEKYSGTIRCIIIRKVIDKAADKAMIEDSTKKLKTSGVVLYYADHFPETFAL